MDRSAFRSLVELVQERAAEAPDEALYTFLAEDDGPPAILSCAGLELRARTIAAFLQARGEPGGRALLLYPPGLEYIAAFFGCLFAGYTAVPLYPPSGSRGLERLTAVARDARAGVALTVRSIHGIAQGAAEQDPAFARLTWVATDELLEEQAAAWRRPRADPDGLAFLQYTSGSTGEPKGVMLTHANLLHNLEHVRRCFDHGPSSRGVIWLPPYHDMGLIGGILQPLYAGFPVALMSPLTFMGRPARWLEAISRYRATTSGGPDFAYELCVRRVPPQLVEQLDLSCWRVAFTGAEPVRADTLDRFAAAFEPAGFRRRAFYPCYGLAEATLIAAGGKVSEAVQLHSVDPGALQQRRVAAAKNDSVMLVGNGPGLSDQTIRIVDPSTGAACDQNEIGEIWIQGPSVAKGYWNNAEQTRETFGNTSPGSPGVFLRTGDLGYLHGGQLYVTGRLKDLIILRGRNYYPQDIERSVEQSHRDVRPGRAVAFSIDRNGSERLIIAQEIRSVDLTHTAEIVESICAAVQCDHQLRPDEVVLLPPKAIPLTSSGKKQRYACREAYLKKTWSPVAVSAAAVSPAAAFAAPGAGPSGAFVRTALAAIADPSSKLALLVAYLRELGAEVLATRVERLDVTLPLAGLGFDSVRALQLGNAIESRLGVSIPLGRLLDGSTLESLARAVIAADGTRDEPELSQGSAAPGEYPASLGQQALWLTCQRPGASVAYNLPLAFRVSGALEPRALGQALRALVARHTALRTTFVLRDGVPMQRVQEDVPACFEPLDAAGWSDARVEAYVSGMAHDAFDLELGPLFRAVWITRDETDHVLAFVAHHTIVDFWSLMVLMDELRVFYAAELRRQPAELPPPAVDCVAHVTSQHAELLRSAGRDRSEHWRRALAPPLPVSNLPTDRPRPTMQGFAGGRHFIRIDAALSQKLGRLAREASATPYMVLVAALDVLLHRYTGQTDILVGTPTAGRPSARFAEAVGYFVNPVVLRADLANDPPFRDFLEQVKGTVLAALKHQEYPFARLVQDINPERDASRAALFQVMLAYERSHRQPFEDVAPFVLGRRGARSTWGELCIESIAVERRTSQFDLTLSLIESGERLDGAWEYDADLFEADTIERLSGHFLNLLEGIVAEPHARVSTLPLMGAEERRLVVETWNAFSSSGPSRCVHEYFEAQAQRTPGATALVTASSRWTYAELQTRADGLARRLQALGVGPEVLVGVYTDRSADLVVAVLGVLMAGGAYVPLDPGYPRQRIRNILEDARVPVIVTQRKLEAQLPRDEAALVYVDDARVPDDGCAPRAASGVTPADLAYVLFTSGSTGRPKGVAIAHRSPSVLLDWAQAVIPREDLAGMLASTSISFDLSVFEIFLPLAVGGAIILAENILQLPELAARDEVTLVNTVPSALAEVVRSRPLPPSVRTVCLAGEPLRLPLVHKLYESEHVERAYNLYGPTEDTTYSTFELVPRGLSGAVSIGRPVSQTRVYVLDAARGPVPIGVPGELYLGGAGLARGYLNRPDLTAERFIADPFLPGERMYRTGDLGRYWADGRLEYLGRLDFQVKLRGYRIELDEIATVLSQTPGVLDSLVLVREDTPGLRQLVAYVILDRTHAAWQLWIGREAPTVLHPAREIVDQLRAALAQSLPEYMVPWAYVALPSWPLTPNGKLDRTALPAPEAQPPELAHTPPSGDVERQVAQIWCELLGVQQVGLHQNFFAAGGHSLLLARMQAQLEERFKRQVTLTTLFERPTIHQIAAFLVAGDTGSHKAAEEAKQRGLEQRTARQRRARVRSEGTSTPGEKK